MMNVVAWCDNYNDNYENENEQSEVNLKGVKFNFKK